MEVFGTVAAAIGLVTALIDIAAKIEKYTHTYRNARRLVCMLDVM